MFKSGDRVIIIHDWSDPQSLQWHIAQRETDLVVIMTNGEHYDKAFVIPELYEKEALEVINKRVKLKKAFDDSMSLVYQFRNKLIRGDFKK